MSELVQNTTTTNNATEVLNIRVIHMNGKYAFFAKAKRQNISEVYSPQSYTPYDSALAAAQACLDRIELFGRRRGRGRRPHGYRVARSLR